LPGFVDVMRENVARELADKDPETALRIASKISDSALTKRNYIEDYIRNTNK